MNEAIIIILTILIYATAFFLPYIGTILILDWLSDRRNHIEQDRARSSRP